VDIESNKISPHPSLPKSPESLLDLEKGGQEGFNKFDGTNISGCHHEIYE